MTSFSRSDKRVSHSTWDASVLPVNLPEAETLPHVLCVDDDASVTASIERVLRRHFTVVARQSGAAGLDLIRNGPPFAVVISDFQMPGMDGAEFLRLVRQYSPTTVRVLLTGRRDLAATVAAVNRGQIYQFLAKPISPEMLTAVVSEARDQHRLLTAERVLLEQTLLGSIKALMSLLSLVQPAALGRTGRIKLLVSGLAERLQIDERWSIEIAALLSQVGCVTLPPATMDKMVRGERLTSDEESLVRRLPHVAETLLAGIPRIETVRDNLRYQDTNFDGTNSPEPHLAGTSIPVGARILKVAIDYDILESQGITPDASHAVMAGRVGWYDPAILLAGQKLWSSTATPEGMRELLLSQVTAGMVFGADLHAPDGMLLAARGQEVTATLADRIRFDWCAWATARPISMIMQPK